MADTDLEEIRRARLQQLRQQQGGGGGGGAGSAAGGQGQDEAEQQKKREAEARASILSQILDPDAMDRLGRIRLVKASRADDVENRLIMLARSGQLKSKVTEAQLKDMLAQLSEHQAKEEVPVRVERRKGGWDDDDLDDLLNDV